MIVQKKTEQGDPCGGAELTVRYVDRLGITRLAKVLQQCTGDDLPGDMVQIRYDTSRPAYAEFADDSSPYARDELHASLIFTIAFLMLSGVSALIAGMARHRHSHAAPG